MNVEHLTAALTSHDADPNAALTALRAKRRRNHGLLVGGVVAAVAVATVAGLHPWSGSRPVLAGANGCAQISLPDTLTMARQGGASVILATGSLTGHTVTDSQTHHEMRLQSIRTLSGPPVAIGSSGWLTGALGPAGPAPGADAGALWATDGHLFAITWPARQAGTAVGPVLRIAPVVGTDVIFSSAGCWDTTGLSGHPYHGHLAEIPGSDSYTRAAQNGFVAVPLSTVERLAG